ncbi:MAG: hypothetical protein QOE16_1498 [Microbacteriaceae bacterium]|nr:hypothetical protein [Microbacteriaceae bacterium]
MTRVWLRWLPAVAVPAVIAAGVLVAPLAAGAAVDLPAKTPEQVLAMVAQSPVRAFSGTLEQTSQLGLPEVPSIGPSSSTDAAASALELLTGSHTARVYVDAPTNARIQVMDSLAERDVIRHGSDVWLYDSSDRTATHLTLPARASQSDGTTGDAATPGEMQTPAQLAKRLLTSVEPSTRVTVGDDTSVAGRTAYDLVLTPRSSVTLVGSVSIAVDSKTGLPLSVEVRARGQQDPAFRIAFSELSLEKPSADLFTFSPPPGATVKQQSLPKHDPTATPEKSARPKPAVSGSGWETVVGVPASIVPSGILSSPLLMGAATSVADGRLLHTSLVNVLLTNDGRLFAGAVPVDRLQAAAAGQ